MNRSCFLAFRGSSFLLGVVGTVSCGSDETSSWHGGGGASGGSRGNVGRGWGDGERGSGWDSGYSRRSWGGRQRRASRLCRRGSLGGFRRRTRRHLGECLPCGLDAGDSAPKRDTIRSALPRHPPCLRSERRRQGTRAFGLRGTRCWLLSHHRLPQPRPRRWTEYEIVRAVVIQVTGGGEPIS